MMQPNQPLRIRASDGAEQGGGRALPRRLLFDLGTTVITANALHELHPEDVQNALRRHHAGDWGTLNPEDWEANQTALAGELRILSVYQDRNRNKFYIITEADRSINRDASGGLLKDVSAAPELKIPFGAGHGHRRRPRPDSGFRNRPRDFPSWPRGLGGGG
jgi:hypothetical protein